MAKNLIEQPPTSSVARLLDRNAVARALSPAASVDMQASRIRAETIQEERAAVRPSIIKREFVLTPETDRILAALVQTYRQTTGARISNSQLIRAVLRSMSYGCVAIEREAQRLGTLKLPSNAKERVAEREQFELVLSTSIVEAMRSLGAPHSG